MTNWRDVMLLVSEESLKSPLYNATIVSVLYALAGSLCHKFGFFMDCLRTFQNKNPRQGRIKLFGAPRQWKHFHPLFQAVFLSGRGITPPDWVKHHASQSQDKFTLMFINERKRNANTYLISNFDSLEAAPSNVPLYAAA